MPSMWTAGAAVASLMHGHSDETQSGMGFVVRFWVMPRRLHATDTYRLGVVLWPATRGGTLAPRVKRSSPSVSPAFRHDAGRTFFPA